MNESPDDRDNEGGWRSPRLLYLFALLGLVLIYATPIYALRVILGVIVAAILMFLKWNSSKP